MSVGVESQTFILGPGATVPGPEALVTGFELLYWRYFRRLRAEAGISAAEAARLAGEAAERHYRCAMLEPLWT